MLTDRITLTLYDENDNPVKTLTRSGLRWILLKKLVRLNDTLTQCEDDIERLDVMIDIIAATFEGQATLEEIEKGVNYDEALATFTLIMNMVNRQKKANFQPGVRK